MTTQRSFFGPIEIVVLSEVDPGQDYGEWVHQKGDYDLNQILYGELHFVNDELRGPPDFILISCTRQSVLLTKYI